MSKTIPTTPELLGVFGSHNVSIINQVGDQMDAELITVANSSDEINLALPYYSFLEDKKASTLSDSDLDAASGGNAAAATPEQREAAEWLVNNVPQDVIMHHKDEWTVENINGLRNKMENHQPPQNNGAGK